MLNYNDPLRHAEEIQGGQIGDSLSGGGLSFHNIDGYQCLEAFGDDLSLEDALLIDTDDLLMSV